MPRFYARHGGQVLVHFSAGHRLKPVLLKCTSRATEEQSLSSEQRTLSE